jgi:dihydroflavonol-4-reductase
MASGERSPCMRKSVFVTGASGMLGANLCRRLVLDGATVTALVRRPLQHPFFIDLPVKQVVGDLSDVGMLRRAMHGCSVVFHTAGRVSYCECDRAELYETNVVGTKNILDAAAGADVRRVVYTSSTAAIGIPARGDKPMDERGFFDDRYRDIPYMDSKNAAEEIALRRDDVEVVAVNPSTILGAGDVYMNTGAMFRHIYATSPAWAPPGGTALVSVRDCVEGHIRACERGIPGSRYILSSDNTSLFSLWTAIARELRVTPPKRSIPRTAGAFLHALGRVHDQVFPRSMRHSGFSRHVITIAFADRYFDASLAQRELGWRPSQDMDDMIREAVDFYRNNGLL